MPTKTAVKKAPVAKVVAHDGHSRLTDEELGMLVGKHLRARPEAAPTMVYAAIRELGKGIDGARVRKQFAALRAKPVAKRAAIKK